MTLTQTAALTKRVIAIFLVMSFLGTISFSGYKIWHAYYIAHLPPIEEKPDLKFGLLPHPDLPTSSVSSSNFSYSIDTSTGILPKIGTDPGFDKIMKVYYVSKSFATLLSPEKSQNLADKFGISLDPKILSETEYKFQIQDKTLSINLDTGNFLYTKDATVSGHEALDNDDKLITDFENVLSTLGVLKDEFKKGRTKITLLKIDGKDFIQTKLRTEAQAVQISIWPQNINNKSIFTPDFNKALVSAIVVKSAENLENYLSLQYIYFPIDITTGATYPIKTTESAYADLKGGKGVIISEPNKAQVSISSIYLGYYLPENYTPYLQPIYVFEGQGFLAYVPAISDDFTDSSK